MTNKKRSTGRTGAKGLFCIALALLGLTVAGVSSASAYEYLEEFTTPSTNPTEQRNWFTGTYPGTKLVGTRAVNLQLVGNTLRYATSVAGTALEFSASGVECANCTIENRPGTGENVGNTEAVFSGQLVLTGMKSIQPASCTMSPTLETKSLTGVMGGLKGSKTEATFRIYPTTGATWASYTLAGASCPIAGTYKFTGGALGELKNAMRVSSKKQTLILNQTIQEALQRPKKYGETGLKFGENPAFLFGEINMTSEQEYSVVPE